MAKFIICIGPPGSGKGYVEENLISFFGSDLASRLKSARIDDYVEKDLDYVKQSYSLIKQLEKNTTINELVEEISKNGINNNLAQSLYNILSQTNCFELLYTKIRNKYNETLDKDINIWLNQRENIIFETTGVNSFDWLFKYTLLSSPDVRKDYTVYLVYPYASIDNIIKRIINRFIDSLINKSSPRLPSLDNVLESVPIIQNNISSYLSRCASAQQQNVDKFLLLDNTSSEVIINFNLDCYKSEKSIVDCKAFTSFFYKNSNKITSKLKSEIEHIISDHCSV